MSDTKLEANVRDQLRGDASLNSSLPVDHVVRDLARVQGTTNNVTVSKDPAQDISNVISATS